MTNQEYYKKSTVVSKVELRKIIEFYKKLVKKLSNDLYQVRMK